MNEPLKVYPPQTPSKLEPYYSRHIAAMTAEGLYLKAAIAEQLAWRDKRIDELESQIKSLGGVL
jgi:hypothetical protein